MDLKKATARNSIIAILAAGGAAQAGETIDYAYDAQGRLVKVERSGAVNANVDTEYEYDDADNRTREKTTGVGGAGSGGGSSGGSVCASTQTLTIVSATDDGTHNRNRGPENSVDGDLTFTSRWSSRGLGKWIVYDLGAVATVEEMRVAWGRSGSHSYSFDIEASQDGSSFQTILTGGQSAITDPFEFETHDVPATSARYIRIVGYGRTSSTLNMIAETEIGGCVI